MVFDRWASIQAEWTRSEAGSPTPLISPPTSDSTIRYHEVQMPLLNAPPADTSTSNGSIIQSRLVKHDKPPTRPKLFKTPSIAYLGVEFLLVEDNPINLKILTMYMNKLGRKYHTATNGMEAVEAYRRSPHECKYILTDVSMPVMNGFEATRQIRAHERMLDLPPATIIALTGLASDDSQNEAFGSGMDLFLTKPVKLKELSSILKTRGLFV